MARGRGMVLVSLFVISVLLGSAVSFYLPGMGAVDYQEGAKVEIYADNLESTKNQFPYEYFSVAFCEPAEKRKAKHLNLGEILMGERDELTGFDINFLAPEPCKVQCTQQLTSKQLKAFRDKINDDYFVHLNADNMPLVMKLEQDGQTYHLRGMPIGYATDGDVRLHNHYELKILYHRPKFSASDLNIKKDNNIEFYRVVGFEGKPWSKDYKSTDNVKCPRDNSSPLIISSAPEGQRVTFTFSVEFEESDIEWATRWDPLLKAQPGLRRVQWFSILNSIAITVLLSAFAAVVLCRTVYLDFARYNNLDDAAEAQEETGWKQVHGDVFRAPTLSGILCVLCGIGAQLVLVIVITLLFAILGFWSPAYRGGLLSGLLLFWVLSNIFSGYVSGRMYAGLSGLHFRLVTLGSSFAYSGVIFAVFFIMNLVLWAVGSSAQVGFFTLLLLLVIWLGVAVPLNILGCYLGYKGKPYEFPTKTAAFHRPIPEGADSKTLLFLLTGGLLPFACVFIELSFILNSLWQDDIFYMFGFLFLVFVILAIACAEVSVVMTYFFLSNEDYRWWWRSFLTPASSGLYVFVYSLVFLNTQPDLKGMHFGSVFLYTCYMLIISASFAILTGFIGFQATFLFVKNMFASVKID